LRRAWTCLLGALCTACTRAGEEASAALVHSGAADGPWFVECARESGLDFVYRSGHREAFYMPEIMGGGAGLFDLEGDGDLDVYLVQGGSVAEEPADPPSDVLFRNEGAWRFSDVSRAAGVVERGYGMGIACGDVDDDGRADVFVTNLDCDQLWRNAGDGRLTDATSAAGIADHAWGASAAFFDADRDGDLDLYVANYLDWTRAGELPCNNELSQPDYCSPKNYKTPARHALWRNQGAGRFADESDASGIASARGTGLGVAVSDFDADGWPDVFVANDGMPNFLWRNRADGTFEDVGMLRGCAVDENGTHKAGMGVAVEDVDLDLLPDILVCNLSRETDSLYLNRGKRFEDRTARFGLAALSKPFTRFGQGLFDLDLDGRLDLYQANGRVSRLAEPWGADPYAEPNLLLCGVEGGFVEVEPHGGTAQPLVATSRAAAFGDLDGDGGVDVLVVNRDAPCHLLRNVAAAPGAATVLQVLESSGRDALGARLVVQIGERSLLREVRSAASYCAANDARVSLGLAGAAAIDVVRVRWADGSEEVFGPLGAGRSHTLRRGAGRALERQE
jgi:hypothetical protein